MRLLAALPLLALTLAGCSAAGAAESTVGPETPEELVALQLADVHEWQDDWQLLGCADATDWDQFCGSLVLESTFTAISVTKSFDRTVSPTVIDGLTDAQRDALIPSVEQADDVIESAQRWQHIDCQDSPAACAAAADETAKEMDALAALLTELDFS